MSAIKEADIKQNKMRKYLITLLLASLFIWSCDKNTSTGGGTSGVELDISSKVQDGTDYNDVISYVIANIVNVEEDVEEIAEGEYKKGGFTMVLPKTVNSKFLSKIEEVVEEEFELDPSDKNCKISSINVNIGSLELECYDSKDNVVGYLYCYKETKSSETIGMYLYADNNVTVKYTGDEDYIVDISLKKGWNIVYYTYSDDQEEFTSKEVSGMKWYFSGGGSSNDGDVGVRFIKEKAYENVLEMAIIDVEGSSITDVLAAHQFGKAAGTSPYYGISAGNHAPAYLNDKEQVYLCLKSTNYNFQKGRAYSVISSDDGTYLTFSVRDDGSYSKSSMYKKPSILKSKRWNNFKKEINLDNTKNFAF